MNYEDEEERILEELEDDSRYRLSPEGLLPADQWHWYDWVWDDACMLRERYCLPIRKGWWESEIQVEALAALAVWVHKYDSGLYEDPAGKISLLFDLERVAHLLRDGVDPWVPERDRAEFLAYVADHLGPMPPGIVLRDDPEPA
jgi:hypothetical protein